MWELTRGDIANQVTGNHVTSVLTVEQTNVGFLLYHNIATATVKVHADKVMQLLQSIINP